VASQDLGSEMPTTIDPMMAVLASGLPRDEDRYGLEFKWDGIRAVTFWDGQNVRLVSRNRIDLSVRYPELWALGEALDSRRAVLDGEIVALDAEPGVPAKSTDFVGWEGRPSFERLQQRMGLTAEADVRRKMVEVPVTYMVFDAIWLDGRPLTGEQYERRRALLEELGLAGPHWQTPPYQVDHGQALLQTSREKGLEGLIAKRLDSVYELGRRSGAWLKVKHHLRQELVIGGWLEGEGRRQGLPGALLVGYYQDGRFVYAGKVGTGFTDAMLARLHALMQPLERSEPPFEVGKPPSRAHFVEPKLVAEFEFSEWTRAGELRAPSFKGLREDKDARDVVRESPAPC
jgi:bifunctional non-homologous end joining protein LigD